jgi:hypothetical protein
MGTATFASCKRRGGHQPADKRHVPQFVFFGGMRFRQCAEPGGKLNLRNTEAFGNANQTHPLPHQLLQPCQRWRLARQVIGKVLGAFDDSKHLIIGLERAANRLVGCSLNNSRTKNQSFQ